MKLWKQVLALMATAILLFALYGLWDSHRETQAAERREASYQSKLIMFQKDLKPGATRQQVELYLLKNDLKSGTICCQDHTYSVRVKIGEEPHPWYCNFQNVYVAFQFDAIPSEPVFGKPNDVLKTTTLQHSLEVCL